MRKCWQRSADRFVQVNLSRSVVNVVGTANDMADLHVKVIDHNSEVVGRNAVATHNDEVIEFGIRNTDRTINRIVPCHNAVVRITEADHRSDTGRNFFTDRVFRTPAPVITGFFTTVLLFFTQLIKLFFCCVVFVCQASFEQVVGNLTIALKAVHLVNDFFIVVVEVQPFHSVKNGLCRFSRGTFLIGILYP